MALYVYCFSNSLKDDRLSHTIIRYSNMLAKTRKSIILIADNNTCTIPLSENIIFIRRTKRILTDMNYPPKEFMVLFPDNKKIREEDLMYFRRGCRIYLYVDDIKKYKLYIKKKVIVDLNKYSMVKYFTDNKKIKHKLIRYFNPIDPYFTMNTSVLDRKLQIAGYYSNKYASYYSNMLSILKKINSDFDMKLVGYNINNLTRKDLVKLFNESMFWVETGSEMPFRIRDAILCGCVVIAPKGSGYDKLTYRFNNNSARMAKIIADMSYDVDKRGEMIHTKMDQFYPLNYTEKCENLENMFYK